MIKKLFTTLSVLLAASVPVFAQETAETQIVDLDNELDETLIPAPDFTLKDMLGNPVSLSSYQGEWVVLDFWGSWCPYCIKGIPAMKEAYAKFHPKGLEIIGIDCNEPESAWIEALGKYELPWVNVYNPGGRSSAVTQEYAIQGYPTKIVVDPQGYIYETFLGEDPAFYELLETIYSNY